MMVMADCALNNENNYREVITECKYIKWLLAEKYA